MERQELIRRAFEAQKKAYAPYSHFQVGGCSPLYGWRDF